MRFALLFLVFFAGASHVFAASEAEALQEILRGRDVIAVKLSALEVFKASQGAGSLGFLDKKDYSRLQESLNADLSLLVSSRDNTRAFALWMRYLRALPADSQTERFRKLPPILAAPIRLEMDRAQQLFDREDYLGAWKVASELMVSGAGMTNATALQARSTQAGETAARFDGLWSRIDLEGSAAAMTELEGLATELTRLHSPGGPPRRARASRLLAEARTLQRSGDTPGVRAKLDEIAALNLPVASLRRRIEVDLQPVGIGSISRVVEPSQSQLPPLPRTAERFDQPSPTRSTTRPIVSPTPRQTNTAVPPTATRRPPTATATPTAVGQPPPAVARRVHESVQRETDFYRRSLRASGATAAVPYFRLEAVELRGWTVEVHLQAASDDPERVVSSLLLPRADRQLLRLVAARILEDAPELASVEIHLALQNGLAAPVSLGWIRVDPELLKLTAGLPIEDFWARIDVSQLELAWP